MDFPGYDAWKLATPPAYEQDDLPEDACQNCDGTGTIICGYEKRPCPECDGTGNDPNYEPRDIAYEHYMRGRNDRRIGGQYLMPPRGVDITEWQNGWLDEDKRIKAEADEPKF
jgi:hypothetical protein